MAQVESKCVGIVQFCRTRVTLLNADGTPDDGATNGYVSDQPVTLAINADIQAATRRTVTSGCGCVLATDAGRSTLLGFALELVSGTWEPAMQSLMLGSTPIYDASDTPIIIGLNHLGGDILGCGEDPREVAFEAWAHAWDGAGQDADFAWKHYVWPRTRWSKAPETIGEEFTQPGLSGAVFQNGGWGSGPYDDVPNDGTTPIEIDFFAEFLTDTEPPTATCGLTTVPA